jgi:POT family proton-dependent oligopeptide transporter
LFAAAAYFFPVVGAVVSDAFLGKYRTIVALSVVYCLGHLALALDDTRLGLAVGLTLIAVGAGGIKPCVSAHVGDQFGQSNRHLIPRVFAWFYFAINLGAFVSSLLTQILLRAVGPHAAFGVPGALMLTATWVFWLGRREFVHIPPGGRAFVREVCSRMGLRTLGRLFVIYAFVAVFWALYDQTGSAWVLQAERMDLRLLGIDWHPAQIQAVNPIMIIVFIPLFSYGVYPVIDRAFPLTPLRKIGIGFFLTVVAFLIPAWIETEIARGARPSIVWQLLAYAVLTAAEVFVSITCLEFSYTQAPPTMKSVVMSVFLMSVSLGNLFTSGVNFLIQDAAGRSTLSGVEYYGFFAAVMLVTALGFVAVASRYEERTYLQKEG